MATLCNNNVFKGMEARDAVSFVMYLPSPNPMRRDLEGKLQFNSMPYGDGLSPGSLNYLPYSKHHADGDE